MYGGGRGMRPPGPRGFLTEEEKKNKPKVTKELLMRILSYLKPYSWQFLLVFAALLLSAVLGLLPSVITGKIVDEIISHDRTVIRLVTLLVLAFTVLAVSQIISVLERYINSWISQMIIRDMRNQMYDHLSRMPHAFFTTEKQGDIITRMNSDINGVSSVISGTLTSVVSNILTVGTCVFYLLYTDWRLALVGIAIIPLLIFPTRQVGKKRWGLVALSQSAQDEMNQHIDETLSVSGSLLVKLFTREKREYERFKEINQKVTDISVKENRTGSWFHVFMGLFIGTVPLLIYFAGGIIIIKTTGSNLTVGDITVVVSLVNRLYGPVRQLLDVGVDFTRSLALFTRIFDYFDKPIPITDPENPKTPDMSDSTVEFKDVRFSYNKEKEVLKGINLKIPSGKTYAIVGASGAGKSTVINLIPRIYDVSSGAVTVAGVDVREFSLEYLRKNIGVVSQDTYLFNGTIKENLLYANPDASESEIENACRVANINEFINSLPDKYDTLVGNRGLKLSGGEKQRISIARVVLKNPKILILDEATSSLDSISEDLIQTALERIMKGRTSIVIAHRLTTVLAADCITVMEKGEITAFGTHKELLKTDSTYKTLYETQFKRVISLERRLDENGKIE